MTRVERWERRSEVPLLLLAFAFLVAYAWPVVDPDMDRDLLTFLLAMSWTVWAAFAVDFGIRLVLAEDAVRYARSHWYDVALIVLPMLRPLRLLRLLALARILNRVLAGRLLGQVFAYVLGSTVAAAVLASIAMLDVEQEAPDANITTFGDALWWSATTVTTVGYGDRYPVTGSGRVIAVALMLVGIALVGAVTASVAAWMVAQVQRDSSDQDPGGPRPPPASASASPGAAAGARSGCRRSRTPRAAGARGTARTPHRDVRW